MTSPATTPAPVSRLVLDLDAWTTLTESLPDLRLPPSFAGVWGPASPAEVGTARSAARARLRERGLVTTDAVSGADTVHPSLGTALEVVANAPVRVDLRTWQGDRAATTALGVTATAGVSLTRLHHVATEGNDPRIDDDAVGVELAIFPPHDVLGAIHRLLPPFPEGPARPGGTIGDGAARVRLAWPDLLALSAALGRTREPGRVAGDVVSILARAAGLDAVPPLLRDLSTGLDGAVRMTVTAGNSTWFGLWLSARGRRAAVRPAVGTPAGGAGGSAAGVPLERWAPGDERDVVMELRPVGPAEFRADLLTTLTAALETAGVAGEMR